ncbi:PREDICTED: riboflavin biosynthesis protein PYRD, chloroplastic [Tarenaya hassleriana]|uniref:riboflavin biosynthesis protein PYRD, chloroplastic n=1 Tax=Tarenaya hassleriana TaxID=28532 RepID=UPI00053C2928|nr:PREDICTED: riboflavin biosynthesis protein PYRD, chloroplastic [Tarenaya hassleriana]
MQIACLSSPISSIIPRTSNSIVSPLSYPHRIFNLNSGLNPKNRFPIVSYEKVFESRTGSSSSILASVRCEEVVEADDEFYMRRCVELARKATGCTSPNPMVGCVIVKDGEVVGEGFHPKAGQPHAEVFALRDAGDLAEGATAYVSLEPCNHFGRTPPCSEALIKAKVKRVVIGMVDPNPIVDSSGINRLRDAGIDVTVGAEEDLCRKLNEAFIHRMLTGKPFLTLRYSMSINGCFLDNLGEGVSESGGYYSKLLQEHDAIILSSSLSDSLSSISSQEPGATQPAQIIVADSAQQPPELYPSISVEESDPKVVIFTEKEMSVSEPDKNENRVETVVLDEMNLDAILEYCYRRGFCSVMLDLRGNIKELERLVGDGINRKLLQKIVVEVLPIWSGKEENLLGPTSCLGSLPVKDLQSKHSGRSILLEGYL